MAFRINGDDGLLLSISRTAIALRVLGAATAGYNNVPMQIIGLDARLRPTEAHLIVQSDGLVYARARLSGDDFVYESVRVNLALIDEARMSGASCHFPPLGVEVDVFRTKVAKLTREIEHA